MLNPELDALRARVLYAVVHGYKIAYASEYVAKLGGLPIPAGISGEEHLLNVLDRLDKGLDLEPVTAREPLSYPPPAPEVVPTVEVPGDAPNLAHVLVEAPEVVEAPATPKGKRKRI